MTGIEVLVMILFAALRHREEITDAAVDWIDSLRSLLSEEEIAPERLREIAVTAVANGIDLRDVVLDRLQPGGDWHGRMEPDQFADFVRAVEAARSRVGGGR